MSEKYTSIDKKEICYSVFQGGCHHVVFFERTFATRTCNSILSPFIKFVLGNLLDMVHKWTNDEGTDCKEINSTEMKNLIELIILVST